MKTKLTLIILSICLISLASAITISSGESYTIQLEESYDYWSIVGNTTEVDLNVTQDGLNVTITPNKYMESDSFEIIFFNKEKEIIYESSGGGGTRTVYVENKTIEYIDKIIYKDREIEVEEDIEEVESSDKSILPILVGTIIIILLLVGGYFLNKKFMKK